ncbi:MAG: poly-gamma-glutamate biosynthesis protein PgsC [Phyllobacteriaceae bacterium]|nr:poly-gamma-glutamate biosynthesis protein PgsC [Phyllobacteriaceae bacterium]
MLIEAIALSLVLGFVLFEITGLTAGGLIAPGYFALTFDQPAVIATCLVTAIATAVIVRGLGFFTILYGRRRFIVAVLLAFALQWTFTSLLMSTEIGHGRLEVVGFVIPGLVASEIDRQGAAPTLLALLATSGLVFLVQKLLHLL